MSEPKSACPKCEAPMRRDTYQVGDRYLSRWLCGASEHVNGSIMRSTECFENELGCVKEQLTAAHADRDQYKEWWATSCLHVKEALELLGVDVSVDGYVPDTWTLREQCAAAQARIAELESQVEQTKAAKKQREEAAIRRVTDGIFPQELP